MNGIGESKNMLTSLGVNFALGLLGSSQNMDAPQGNLYGDYGIGSAYYKDKLEMLKNGVHERTTAPYYYDPYTGARMDLHKSRNYTAYNFKNDISAIKSFDLGNWVNDKVTDFGNKLNNGIRDLVYGKSAFVIKLMNLVLLMLVKRVKHKLWLIILKIGVLLKNHIIMIHKRQLKKNLIKLFHVEQNPTGPPKKVPVLTPNRPNV